MQFAHGRSTLPVQNLHLWGVSWLLWVFPCASSSVSSGNVSFCADVDLLLAGILACPEEAGRDVMLFAGRRIPAGNAGVDGILCTGWGSPAGFVAEFGAVLAPLASQRGGNVPELPRTPAESAAWSWSRRWELLMPGISAVLSLSCGRWVCWECSPELQRGFGWAGGCWWCPPASLLLWGHCVFSVLFLKLLVYGITESISLEKTCKIIKPAFDWVLPFPWNQIAKSAPCLNPPWDGDSTSLWNPFLLFQCWTTLNERIFPWFITPLFIFLKIRVQSGITKPFGLGSDVSFGIFMPVPIRLFLHSLKNPELKIPTKYFLNEHLESLESHSAGIGLCSHGFQPCHNWGEFQKQGGIIFLSSVSSWYKINTSHPSGQWRFLSPAQPG